MRRFGLAVGTMFLTLFLVFGIILTSLAQDSAGEQAPTENAPSKAARAMKKSGKTNVAPPLKAGEVVPLEQSSDTTAAPATPTTPATSKNAPSKPQPAETATPAPAPAPAVTETAPAEPTPAPAPTPASAKGRKGKAQAAPQTAPQAADDGPVDIRPQRPVVLAGKSKLAGGKLTIGALLPLSGALAAQGQSSKAALELAVNDVNAYLAENGSSERVTLDIQDTTSAGPKALERLKAMAAAGVRLVIGPYGDDEVDAVLDFANKNGVMLLSHGSAGPYLAKPGDNLFRFSPSDAFQAEALAVLASQEGATQIIPIWEGDMYGDELITHIKGQFANLGGEVLPGTRFRPEVQQVASYVADLKAQIAKHVKDKKKLAIVVAARGSHTAGILREAAKLGGLDDAKWYGCDDAALRGSIVKEQDVAQFAAKVRMAFARYGETGTALYTEVEKRLEERLQAFVDTQAVVAYDVVWLAAFTGMASGDDPVALRKAIPATAERFYGASGWLALNENGDRREDYDFDFWTIKNMDGKFYWVKTARYQFDPGSVKQLIVNAPEKE